MKTYPIVSKLKIQKAIPSTTFITVLMDVVTMTLILFTALKIIF